MKRTVVYLGSAEGAESAAHALKDIAELRAVEADVDRVATALRDADGVLDASMKVRITAAMIQSAPRLKIISCATTGSDHIDAAALRERGVELRTLKEDGALLRNITPAAELSWALLLACARGLKGAFKHVEDGLWVRERFPGIMLNGRTLGLVGCGRIGGWMSRYARAFGMHVLGHDPYQETLPEGIERRGLAELVRTADFLSIHVHLSPETRGLISRELLAQCKPGMILINTSRGAIVDECALLDGLRSGRIGAAGLDVLEGEPAIASHALVEYARMHANLLITPHCGGYSPDAVRVVCAHAAKKIAAVLSR